MSHIPRGLGLTSARPRSMFRVRHAGVVVAESERPKSSFKTGLPVRRYLPFADVQVDLLAPAAGVKSAVDQLVDKDQ